MSFVWVIYICMSYIAVWIQNIRFCKNWPLPAEHRCFHLDLVLFRLLECDPSLIGFTIFVWPVGGELKAARWLVFACIGTSGLAQLARVADGYPIDQKIGQNKVSRKSDQNHNFWCLNDSIYRVSITKNILDSSASKLYAKNSYSSVHFRS